MIVSFIMFFFSVFISALFIPEFSPKMGEMILIPYDCYKDYIRNKYKEVYELL